MNVPLIVAALLAAGIGVAHSVLGERYLLVRLFRRGNLPKLFGGTEFTARTLRFAWHVTSVAWLGFAALLLELARPSVDAARIGAIVGATFMVHCLVALVGSRGRHLSWIVFLAIGLLALAGTRG